MRTFTDEFETWWANLGRLESRTRKTLRGNQATTKMPAPRTCIISTHHDTTSGPTTTQQTRRTHGDTTMTTITAKQLHEALDNLAGSAVASCDIKAICVDWEMSENHIGGDDIVAIATALREAILTGYRVFISYGPNTEVLIVGYRQNELAITDDWA